MQDASKAAALTRNPTKADVAYSALRRAIVTSEIPGGVPLDEAELAETFELGRTPIREALKRLAVERFVLWLPRRPPIVAEMSVKDVKKLFEARAALEESVCRISTSRITDAQVEHLFELCTHLGNTLRSGEYYEAVETDYELHNRMAEGSDNTYLARSIATLNSGALRLWFQTFEQNPDPDAAEASHRRVIEAIASGDADESGRALREQMASALQRQLQLGTEPSPQRIHLTDVG
jgi:GntR family transcriptional regulator, rspAB operon transcriptional repressor